MFEQEPPLIFEDRFAQRRNMAWRVEPGRLDTNNPLMVGEYPWDQSTPFYNGTVLKDPIDGLWKLWGIACALYDGNDWGEWDQRMGYATSTDGVHWTRPMLEGFPCLGQERSNVLLDFPDGGSCFQMSVLVDPDAKEAQRYEMFILRNPKYKNPSGRIKDLPDPSSHKWGLYRYFSSDGIAWKAVEGPLAIESADSLFVYKDIGAPYVAFHKFEPVTPPGSAYVPHDCAAGSLRTIVRRDSPDGSSWSDPPLPVVVPDWRDAHDAQCMDCGPLKHGRGYIATVPIFHGLNQMMDIQFAGSPDGRKWFRPIPRVPCVGTSALGDCGGGHLFQSHSLVEDDGQVHLYYFAGEGLHADLYTPIDQQRNPRGQEACHMTGGLARATWDRGRYWAIVPSAAGPSQAVVTTFPLDDVAGKSLYINAATIDDGQITAELTAGAGGNFGPAVEGFTRQDSLPFRGDSKCTPLRWKKQEQCPRDGLLLHLYIRRARLYGFEWR